jgi:preprotein translocase subunit YajC
MLENGRLLLSVVIMNHSIKSRFLTPLVALAVISFSAFAAAQEAGQVFSPAPAAAQQPTFMSSLISMLPMLVICYFIFYFMVIKPQDVRNKKHKSLVDSLKRGDSVVTSSGIVGKVAGLEKEYVLLEVAANVKIKVLQAHVVALEVEQAAA